MVSEKENKATIRELRVRVHKWDHRTLDRLGFPADFLSTALFWNIYHDVFNTYFIHCISKISFPPKFPEEKTNQRLFSCDYNWESILTLMILYCKYCILYPLTPILPFNKNFTENIQDFYIFEIQSIWFSLICTKMSPWGRARMTAFTIVCETFCPHDIQDIHLNIISIL